MGMDVASASAMAAFVLSLSKKAAIRSSGSAAVSTASIRGTGSREAGKQRAREGVKEHAGRVATTSKAVATLSVIITMRRKVSVRGGTTSQRKLAFTVKLTVTSNFNTYTLSLYPTKHPPTHPTNHILTHHTHSLTRGLDRARAEPRSALPSPPLGPSGKEAHFFSRAKADLTKQANPLPFAAHFVLGEWFSAKRAPLRKCAPVRAARGASARHPTGAAWIWVLAQSGSRSNARGFSLLEGWARS